MTGAGQQPSPGWYDDPHDPGAQRWWDGVRWSEHTQRKGGGPAFVGGPAGPMSPDEARNWAMAAHFSAIVSAFVALGFLGPLVVYLVKRDENPYVRQHAAEALNFNLSMLLYGVVGAFVIVLLTLVLIGFLLLPLLLLGAIVWLVLCIVGGVKASQGQVYRYPFTIRFVS
jgi:uncharacterized Tic20 family protein